MEDADFVVALRTNAAKSKYINATSPLIERQMEYIKSFQELEGEAYFIIKDLSERRLGTVRLYDGTGDSFSWGSWITIAGAAPHVAIESALIVYSYAVGHLGFQRSHFSVHKANERVCLFHERFGATKVAEDGVENHYVIDRCEIDASLNRYRRFLPHGITVCPRLPESARS